jgi:hypothetical protein
LPPLESEGESIEDEFSSGVTRRDFLRGAAAGALGSAILAGDSELAAQDKPRTADTLDFVTMNMGIGLAFESALLKFKELDESSPLSKGYRRYLEENLREVRGRQETTLDSKRTPEFAQQHKAIETLFEDSRSFNKHMLSYSRAPRGKQASWSDVDRDGFIRGLQVWAVRRETSPERLLKHYDDRATELLTKGTFDKRQAAQFVLREIVTQKNSQRVRQRATEILHTLRAYDFSVNEEEVGLAIYNTLNAREKFWSDLLTAQKKR